MIKECCAHIQLAAIHGELRLVKNIDANSKMVETLYIHVDFRSADWDELTKSAIYIRSDVEPVAVPIIDGCAVVPWEILDISQDIRGDVYYEVGILGVGKNGERLPTNKVRLKINRSCCVSTSTPKDPTPTVYEQIISMIKGLNDYSEVEIKEFISEYCSENNIATESWVESKNYLTEHQDISGKQDIIDDLADIRTGAALGKTAIQEHQSLSGLATETYVNTKISEIPTPDVSGQINIHNTSNNTHSDIRALIDDISSRLNSLADSDDETLDQLSEVVEYIKNNRSLIDGITTNKINISDIIDNLTTNISNKPLSAAQGVVLKELIDAIDIPTKTSDIINDSGFLTEHQSLDGYATEQWVEEQNYLTEHQDISGKVDKEPGKTLTSNDFTDEDRVKLDNIEYGAEMNAVNDILIKNTSLVTDGIANIPLGSTGVLGVFQTGINLGVLSNTNSQIYLDYALNSEITARNSYRKPIVTKNFDYAVKAAMCDGKGAAWTDTEQKAARVRMGVDVIEDKLDVLWKLNEGISYDFVTDGTEGYIKTVPSGGKYAAVESIGGNTVVWNQLVNHDIIAPTPVTSNGVTWTYNGDGSYTLTGTITATYSTLNVIQNSFSNVGFLIVGHKYLYNLSSKNITATSTSGIFTISEIGDNPRIYMQISGRTAGDVINEKISPRFIDLTLMFGEGNEPTSSSDPRITWINQYVDTYPEYNAGELVSVDVYDVVEQGKNLAELITGYDTSGANITSTKVIKSTSSKAILGVVKVVGGDKYTVSFGNAFNDRRFFWFSEYPIDTGAISVDGGYGASLWNKIVLTAPSNAKYLVIRISANNFDFGFLQVEEGSKATDYLPYHSNIYTIPTNVRSLTGYGWSAGSLYNGIERTENGWQYVQRVGLPITDTGYTVLAEPIITDITDLMIDFPKNFEVEAGGTITFNNTVELSVPNTVKYLRALAEVEASV